MIHMNSHGHGMYLLLILKLSALPYNVISFKKPSGAFGAVYIYIKDVHTNGGTNHQDLCQTLTVTF
jgi:hypothetical protein